MIQALCIPALNCTLCCLAPPPITEKDDVFSKEAVQLNNYCNSGFAGNRMNAARAVWLCLLVSKSNTKRSALEN